MINTSVDCLPQNIKIFIDDTDGIQVAVKIDEELDTLWLTQKQISTLFDKNVRTVSEHLQNIYKEKELAEDSTIRNFRIVQKEGAREVARNVEHYNLDAILSVGYRVNSKKGTQFRVWATKVLKEHIIKGYTLDQKRFEKNSKQLQQAIELIRSAAQTPTLSKETANGLVDIITSYTQTFLWLQRYDEGLLEEPKCIEQDYKLPSVEQAMNMLNQLKENLIQKGEASGLFAQVRGEGLNAIFGALEQSVFGEPAYPSIESKAAHLLYFVVKNHPFADGNKRSGAFLFVDFLQLNNRLLKPNGEVVINDAGLAALTLLVAESDPKQKELIINLIMHMLAASS